MPKKTRFFRINQGEYEAIYELVVVDKVKTTDKGIQCPCCQSEAYPIADVIQWGFWEDTYQTYFLCQSCLKAYLYAYVLVCTVENVTAVSD